MLLASSFLVLNSCSLSCVAPLANAESPEYNLVSEMISEMNETEIYNSINALQGFITREYGTPGNMQSGDYIYNKLSSLPGLEVEYQSEYNNVVATLYGVDNSSTSAYIVGAHYDSISSNPSYAPGATDNGGGVAIVLEFARIMSHYRFNKTLIFAFWNAEEPGLLGSIEYVKYAQANGIDVSLYMNFDSSCYDPDNRMILGVISNQQSNWVANMLTEHNNLYGVNFTLTYNTHMCLTDHESFWEYGYPAISTHSESHGPAHSPQDTVDAVSTAYAKRNGQLGMSVIATLAEVVNNEIPEFTSTSVVVTALFASAMIIVVSARKGRRSDGQIGYL